MTFIHVTFPGVGFLILASLLYLHVWSSNLSASEADSHRPKDYYAERGAQAWEQYSVLRQGAAPTDYPTGVSV